jgi:hypothetical protein
MRDKRQTQRKRIGLLLFDGITALDVAGPMEAFAGARLPEERNATPCYELITIGLTFCKRSGEHGSSLLPAVQSKI